MRLQLPDVRQNAALASVYRMMGITNIAPLPLAPFTRLEARRVERPRVPDNEARQWINLTTKGRDIEPSEVKPAPDGGLLVDGAHVLVYIPIQDPRWSDANERRTSYRFHIAHCSTIEQMGQSRRYDGYRAIRRLDGQAPVLVRDSGKGWQDTPMDLCKNCIKVLKERGRWFTPFNYATYFTQFENEAPQPVPTLVEEEVAVTYTPDWPELSQRLRESAGWRCQRCNVDLRAHKDLLHVHHVNGQRGDNEPTNLQVLCVACHAVQPMHDHMRFRHASAIAQVESLRAAQRAELYPIGHTSRARTP